MPKPTNVRHTINIPIEEDKAEVNPARTMVASERKLAMRRPRVSAREDHNMAPKIIPSIPIRRMEDGVNTGRGRGGGEKKWDFE